MVHIVTMVAMVIMVTKVNMVTYVTIVIRKLNYFSLKAVKTNGLQRYIDVTTLSGRNLLPSSTFDFKSS